MAASSTPPEVTDGDACYLAMKTHDARFDGAFFTAVTSTGIYCRPVCRVKLPRRENCRFFRHAAQAEAAGFRPCLRCRPELAPRTPMGAWSTEDAARTLALQAARLMDEPQSWMAPDAGAPADEGAGGTGAMQRVAQRLGVSDRHLRRIFEAQFGVSPLQYLLTRRLLAAKQLLADTSLPMAEVALASGFGSARRFHDAFQQRYGLSPGALRRAAPARKSDSQDAAHQGCVEVRLAWRPPYDVAAMWAFLGRRALPGAEQPSADGRSLQRTLALMHAGQRHTGWLQVRVDEADGPAARVRLQLSESLAPALPTLIARVRGWLDLDADPQPIHAVLGAAFPAGEGLRVPGTLDGFELAVRAVLGQQITVAAARTLGGRLVQALGEPIATPFSGLTRLFPTPAALAGADPDLLGSLGIVRQRQAAIQALARESLAGRLQLQSGADPGPTCAALQTLPGIGDWTAQYIAMRALRWPDAFPAGDIALQKALGVKNAKAAAEASQAWRPWRSYAVLRAWAAA
ncbi:helix-turn-helix domain-containing protein [Xenophilus arseniciresistens]|uniref:DNA-3-methyladenine glycosylase II n=1 Tax=Xenophilus arseniciresistens TaxID=1283306 RepID=A0AAE3N4Y1_9BURK|nr:AlkA N-terminal domain-containing protein [Xenophilus arseniciresistens]MDA7414978.1 helix-turn-helix domain-containing protein [Xenophilus arseniciresistens]